MKLMSLLDDAAMGESPSEFSFYNKGENRNEPEDLQKFLSVASSVTE